MKFALSKYTSDNFRLVMGLNPVAQPVFRELLWRVAMQGIYIRITDAARTLEDQWNLFLIGRPWLPGGKEGYPITWVSGDRSLHTWNLAIDIAVMDRIGPIEYRAIWSGKRYEAIGKIAMELGIRWGFAEWGVDKPHFDYIGGLYEKDPVSTLRTGQNVKPPEFDHVPMPKVLLRARDRLLADGISS